MLLLVPIALVAGFVTAITPCVLPVLPILLAGGGSGGGFLLGASLGLVFVPCGGPVFGAVSGVVGLHRVGGWTVVLALVYAVGAALPMLAIARGGAAVAARF